MSNKFAGDGFVCASFIHVLVALNLIESDGDGFLIWRELKKHWRVNHEVNN